MYTRDYLRLIEIFWIIILSFIVYVVSLFLSAMIVLYTRAGNVRKDTVEDALDW